MSNDLIIKLVKTGVALALILMVAGWVVQGVSAFPLLFASAVFVLAMSSGASPFGWFLVLFYLGIFLAALAVFIGMPVWMWRVWLDKPKTPLEPG